MLRADPVPQPAALPIIGHLTALEPKTPVQSLMKLAERYGPFFRLEILGTEFFTASSQAIVDELCDETRFMKKIDDALGEIRLFGGDGLFTAHSDEPNWAKAHRILMPAFGPMGVRKMLPDMVDVADQMMTRWERFGPDAVIDVADDMTRLTLDTIALCAFGYRFNSFYQTGLHPFVDAMVRALSEAGRRVLRPRFVSDMMVSATRRYHHDADTLRSVARNLIAQRRADPDAGGRDDLLDLMLNGRDPQTGDRLSEENIAYQMVTFLIAGHETTSGLLSFSIYLLMKHPTVLAKVRDTVDRVLGDDQPQGHHLGELRYIEQILMEALRLWPTAPTFNVTPIHDTVVGGRYALAKGDTVTVLIPMLHRDPAVWGDDPGRFDPDRFAPENAEKLPPNAWKPFGNGARSCIGRPFAMQEAQLALAMLIQRFDLVADDPSYQLKIHETLTLKPDGFRIRVKARRTFDRQSRPSARTAAPSTPQPVAIGRPEDGADKVDLLVLYGSNTGSSESFASRIAGDAAAHGFAATLAPMDAYATNLPDHGAIVVVTASYEGQPPDNARAMMTALDAAGPQTLDGVRFAVFGCGNRQWARTYQAIPKRVDRALGEAGASRIVERGEADSGGDFFGGFDAWYAALWPALGEAFGKNAALVASVPALDVEFVRHARESTLGLDDLRQGEVIDNRELVDMSAPDARSKRCIEIALPAGMTYRTGDYLSVLPRNPGDLVDLALRHFALSAHTSIVISSPTGRADLPLGQPISVGELLACYVELAQPATRRQVAAIADTAGCPFEKRELAVLAGDDYEAQVLATRLSVLDLLDRFGSCRLEFPAFLAMLPALRARQYSISSSPLWRADRVTLTVAVLDAQAYSGSGRFRGTASTWLAARDPGDRLSMAVHPSNARFRPPADPAVPIIMICAGSGIAPFRGFLQERAIQRRDGRDVGPALLFFGGDHPDVDFLYRDELKGWETDGIVSVLPAFSAQPVGGVTFVQHRVWAERARVKMLFEQGATVFVCGDGARMAPAVRAILVSIYREATGVGEAEAAAWADEMERDHGRYVADVFG